MQTATEDLEAHLESIDEKLEALIRNSVQSSGSDPSELQLIEEERQSTQNCLQICAQLSEHINLIQVKSARRNSSHGSTDIETSSETFMNEGLQECKNSLAHTAAKLGEHMKTLIDRVVAKSLSRITSEEEAADLMKLKDQWETTRQCMDICYKADKHINENISTIVNYATGDDAIQLMVSTGERVIHGTNRGLGWRPSQFGGHASDVTVQQVSRDFSNVRIPSARNDDPSSRGNMTSVHNDAAEAVPSPGFNKRYGQGFKLMSNSV